MLDKETAVSDPLAKKLTYVLRKPVNVGGNLLTEVTCREATVADLDGFQMGAAGSMRMGEVFSLIARCSGIPRPHLDKITAQDAWPMVQMFLPFLGFGEEGGESS